MIRKFAAVAAIGLLAGGAQATTYNILSSSTLNDLRKVGGQNIPEINDYTTYGGSLDPLDPASWPLMDANMASYPYLDPSDPLHAVGIELNNINVSGLMTIVGGSVTAAIVNQLNPLTYGTYQSSTVQNNLVTGDPGVIGVDPLSGTPVLTAPLNTLVWTYNPVTNQLNHQSGGGTAATSANVATCVPVVGVGISGQCRQLQAAVDASGELGQANIGNSFWNWNGMAANYVVRDSASTPWHTATGTSSTGGLQISGAAGQPGVIWDYSGFVDGVGGVVTARVVADVLTGNSATGVSGLYTFNLAVVPVPGAVWLFGSALGVMGWMRRKSAA